VDDCVGVDLHFGHPDDGLWDDKEQELFKDISAITQFGAIRCFISRLEDKSCKAEPIDAQCVWKKPNILKYLWIDGYIRPTLFNHLTKDLHQLRTLVIHFSTLSALTTADFCLGTLKTLEKFTIRLFDSDKAEFEDIYVGITHAITLLESGAVTFPRLLSLWLCLPLAPGHMRVMNRGICTFLRRHAQSVKRFKLAYYELSTWANPFIGKGARDLLNNVAEIKLQASTSFACFH